MTVHDAERLQAAINDLERKLVNKIDAVAANTQELARSVSGIAAQCGICGKTVLGNGKSPLSERISHVESVVESVPEEINNLWKARQADHDDVVRLKERDETRVRIGWKSLAAIVGITGLVFTCISVVLNYLKI